MIHKDHVSAVMDVSFSPTGQEFATASYDRTVRVFPHRSGRSREVYYTKRMQRVFCVNFSADARQVDGSCRPGSMREHGRGCPHWHRQLVLILLSRVAAVGLVPCPSRARLPLFRSREHASDAHARPGHLLASEGTVIR